MEERHKKFDQLTDYPTRLEEHRLFREPPSYPVRPQNRYRAHRLQTKII